VVPRPTNREIEIKLPVRDVHALIRRLRSLGAVSRGRVFEQNTLYDTPDSDLRRSGRVLRIRTETPIRARSSRLGSRSRSVITSKAPPIGSGRAKPKYKERREREVVIERPGRWPGVLRSLGFRPGFRYEKFRTSFRLPGLHLDLDETPAGMFLELEGQPKAIDRVAKLLGYSLRDYLRATYWDVYAADCRRRGVTPKNMVFDKKKFAKSALYA
jgi:adenylate cyclase, class 2